MLGIFLQFEEFRNPQKRLRNLVASNAGKRKQLKVDVSTSEDAFLRPFVVVVAARRLFLPLQVNGIQD